MAKERLEEFELANGLRVGLIRRAVGRIYSEIRFFHATSHEGLEQHGAAHFLEHVIINGGGAKLSPKDVRKMRASFGDSNAHTNHYFTSYEVDCLPERSEEALGFLADITFLPRLDPKVLEHERGRVLREISDTYAGSKHEKFLKTRPILFGAQDARRRHPLGSSEVIAGFSREDLSKFHSQGYFANNAQLVLVGDLPENVREIVERDFSPFPVGQVKPYSFGLNNQIKGAEVLRIISPELLNKENPEESSAELVILANAPTFSLSESPALGLINNILGGGAHSRLFDRVSREEGLAYRIGSTYHGEKHHGILEIVGLMPSRKTDYALNAIFEETEKLRKDSIDPDFLDLMKGRQVWKMRRANEEIAKRASRVFGEWENGVSVEDYVEAIMKVTPRQVEEVARKYLPDRESENYAVVIADPLFKEGSLQ